MTVTAGRGITLYLFTGFLGSGKTTLIRGLLTQSQMRGTAVIVNEFGAVGIDDAIFSQTLDYDRIYLLSNGCLCCASGDDLPRTIKKLLASPDAPNRIILETSGLADPGGLLQRLLSDRDTSSSVRIGGIVATVDGVNGINTLERQAVSQRQAAIADQRIVTKGDIADPETLLALSERLIALNPGASISFVSNGDVNAHEIIDQLRFDPFGEPSELESWFNKNAYWKANLADRRLHSSSSFLADAGVCSWTIQGERPIEWSMFSNKLAAIVARHGDALLRLKGIVYTTGDLTPLVIHSVQRLFHPPVRMQEAKPGRGYTFVIIGEAEAEPAVQLVREAANAASGDAR